MAGFTIDGLDDFCVSFEAVAQIPDGIKSDMLNAGADVIVAAQKASAPKNTGKMSESIKKKPPLLSYSGGSIMITLDGTHHTNKSGRSRYRNRGSRSGGATSNAEVGFIQEFGAPGRNIKATEWMKKTNESNADKAVQAEAAVHDNWLTKCGL